MKEIKIYNFILPPFMLFVFVPWLWLLSLAGNFVIDSIVVLIISLIIFKQFDLKLYKSTILKVWGFGFFAYIVGVAYLFVVGIDMEYKRGDSFLEQIETGIYYAVNHSHFDSIYGVLFILSGVLLSAILIFLMNFFITLKNTMLTKTQRLIMSLSLAVLTAPYTFLLPKELFY